MGTVIITRPPRRPAPPMPTGEIAIEPPPVIPQPTGQRWQQWLTVLPLLAGTVATALMFSGQKGAGTYTYVVGGLFGLSTLGMLITNWGGQNGPHKAELIQARRDYLRYLAGLRRTVRAAIVAQRTALAHHHPDPQALWSEAFGPRVWERRPTDRDFAVVRIGLGPQALGSELIAPDFDPTANLEPVTTGAVRRFLDAYAVVPDLPVALNLRGFTRVVLDSPAHARPLARAMVAQLATFHAPDDLIIAACVAADQRPAWDWLKWLPHALHPTKTDALGPRRLLAASLTELDELLADVVATRKRATPGVAGSAAPQVVLLIDGGDTAGSAHLGSGLDAVTFVDLGGPPPAPLDAGTIVLSADAAGVLSTVTADERARVGTVDTLSLVEAETLARRLAPLRLAGAAKEHAPLARDFDLAELLGIPDATAVDVAALWRPRSRREFLRVPIGTGTDGGPVHIDLKESAEDGMGPHGMLVGITGSGKSELLRTLVLGLATTHSSEELNFVLVDFKGGATFSALDQLPHTSALITNLEKQLPLVDRFGEVLEGELARRSELLNRAGNLSSLREYRRAARADLPALATLVIVCDEFTELIARKPAFAELFDRIARQGRSLGMHLLLATQKFDEGRTRGLEGQLNLRISLRTQHAMDSRAVLKAPDAAELPAAPGHGYLTFGGGPLTRFKAAYVSGRYRRRGAAGAVAGAATGVLDYHTHHVAGAPAEATPLEIEAPESLLELLVAGMRGRGPAAHKVWLPPLDRAPSLDDLLGAIVTVDTPGRGMRGLTVANPSLRGALQVPVALVDKPFEQRHDVCWLDLAGAAGHVGIVGAPQSGKSTAVATLVTALALTHTPREVQVYCLDFGGGRLATLRGLPHVGGVAGRLDAAAVRRTVGEVATLLADRERRFAARGIDSIATFRRLRRPADFDSTVAVAEDEFGDVVLLVDGWQTLRHDFEDLEPIVIDLATRGLSYGIHLVATGNRWLDFRSSMTDLFGAKLELRLGDAADSVAGRARAEAVPKAAPGRGLTSDGAHLMTALPQLTAMGPDELVKAIDAAWAGDRAQAVRLLPPLVDYTSFVVPDAQGIGRPVGTEFALPLGLAENDLRPVLLDFAAESHLVVYGDSECGKSNVLRVIAESLTRRFTPDRAKIMLVDYRRSLLGAVPKDYEVGYGTAAEHTEALMEALSRKLHERRPGVDVTAEQLRTRSWWTGAECFVLIDDYDLVATGPNNPILPLVEHLAHGRDVGLHVIAARRAGGAGMASFDPLLKTLRELASPGLVMSGDRNEGPLVGAVRPSPQPPGRGWLVTRKEGARLVQLAHLPVD
ncbi:type VII secretion protein EccCa [Luedemannella helvata]|uniref:Type VII secretion protein EccC n=1 Tax=Luedemannella helvata TaxID=349315 RepID=A0ABP4WFW1_9ACTN